MTLFWSLTQASGGLRHSVGAGSGAIGFLRGTARAGRATPLGCGKRWQQSVVSDPVPSVSGRVGNGIRLAPAGNLELRTQARWFAVSARWRSEGPKGAETGKKAESRHDASLPDTSSALRKMLPAMSKTNLRENIYTIPNILTASRLVAAPFIGYCILHDYHAAALGLFVYAGITDALDGWIARRWNLKTVVGTIIDPMADKTLMTILTVALAIKGALPVWLAVIILGRDVALAISAIYYRWISLPPPKTFSRYWDFSLPSAEVRPTTISKYNTALQLGLMGLTTLAPVIPAVDMSTALGVMQYVVATTTIWSGASYIYSKDAVKILTQPKADEEKADDKDPK